MWGQFTMWHVLRPENDFLHGKEERNVHEDFLDLLQLPCLMLSHQIGSLFDTISPMTIVWTPPYIKYTSIIYSYIYVYNYTYNCIWSLYMIIIYYILSLYMIIIYDHYIYDHYLYHAPHVPMTKMLHTHYFSCFVPICWLTGGNNPGRLWLIKPPACVA